MREGARVLAEGYDAEFFLHGTAVPLTSKDHVLALTTPDDDGLVEGVARAAEAEGIGVTPAAGAFTAPGCPRSRSRSSRACTSWRSASRWSAGRTRTR